MQSSMSNYSIWKEKIHFLNNSESMVNSNWDVRNDALDTNDAEDTSDTCLFWINHQPTLSIFNINLLTLLKTEFNLIKMQNYRILLWYPHKVIPIPHTRVSQSF